MVGSGKGCGDASRDVSCDRFGSGIDPVEWGDVVHHPVTKWLKSRVERGFQKVKVADEFLAVELVGPHRDADVPVVAMGSFRNSSQPDRVARAEDALDGDLKHTPSTISPESRGPSRASRTKSNLHGAEYAFAHMVTKEAVLDAPLMLSVSGARGWVGRSMTPALAAEFAATFGSILRERSGVRHPLVCLGRDSRPSGEMLALAAASGLLAAGCHVIELGVVTTPTVGVMIGVHRAAGGLVVTASHNPIEWNGLKCLDASAAAPASAEALALIDRFRSRGMTYAAVTDLSTVDYDRTGHERHIARVLRAVDAEVIRHHGAKVVLDSVNGAGCVPGRMLLEELGCRVLQINGDPSGHFAHAPEPLEQNLHDLVETVRASGSSVGFAQDPDADRLAIVDERGRYIGEECTLALAARRMLVREAGAGTVFCANLSTSRMIDEIARSGGARVVRTAVGEANVVEAMRREGAILGGEGNGGVIVPSVCWVRDSLASMALVLELMATEGRALSEIVDDLPRFAMIKRKMDLAACGGQAAIAPALERVAHAMRDRGDVLEIDGVRVDLPEGWVHLRASNTEPIIRLIAEAADATAAATLADEVGRIAGL